MHIKYSSQNEIFMTYTFSTGSQQPTTGSQQPSTGSQQPSTGSQQPTTGSQQPSTGANQTVQINSSILLLGSNTTNIKLDILLLEIKKYIYFCRNKLYKPSINGLRNHLTTNLNVYRNTKMFEKGENIMTFVEHIIQNLP